LGLGSNRWRLQLWGFVRDAPTSIAISSTSACKVWSLERRRVQPLSPSPSRGVARVEGWDKGKRWRRRDAGAHLEQEAALEAGTRENGGGGAVEKPHPDPRRGRAAEVVVNHEARSCDRCASAARSRPWAASAGDGGRGGLSSREDSSMVDKGLRINFECFEG
jgi:hypothetical protein